MGGRSTPERKWMDACFLHPVPSENRCIYENTGEKGNGRCAHNIYIGLERNEKAYFKLDRLTRWRLDFRAPRSNDDERARYRRIRQRESGQFPQRGSERSIFGELWNWWKSRDRVEIAILRVRHSTRQSFFG